MWTRLTFCLKLPVACFVSYLKSPDDFLLKLPGAFGTLTLTAVTSTPTLYSLKEYVIYIDREIFDSFHDFIMTINNFSVMPG